VGLNNAFSRPSMGMAAPAAQSPPAHDTMRYTAVIDDLKQRLRKEGEKKQGLENQITRLNQTLASVKNEANAKLRALQSDLGALQATEAKLRKEVAARPVVKETKGAFENQVQATLEAEAAEARVAEAGAKLATLEKRSTELGAEVDLLKAHRAAALGAVAPKDGSLSEEAVEKLLAKAGKAAKRLQELSERRDALKDEAERFNALAESRRADAAAARRDAALAAESMAEAAAEASRAQTKELSGQLKDAHAELGRVNALVADAQTALDVAQSAAHGGNVTGATVPARALHAFEDTALARAAARSRFAIGTPAPLAFDCPTTIGAQGAADAQGQAMVDAVIADLTLFFTNSIAESAQRALPKTPSITASA
jgi:chromosome segregation ATPase